MQSVRKQVLERTPEVWLCSPSMKSEYLCIYAAMSAEVRTGDGITASSILTVHVD